MVYISLHHGRRMIRTAYTADEERKYRKHNMLREKLARSCFSCGSKGIFHLNVLNQKKKKVHAMNAVRRHNCSGHTRQRSDASTENQQRLMNIDVIDDNAPPVDYPKPYEEQCHMDVPVGEHEVCEVKFNAVVDTESHISLLKRDVLVLIIGHRFDILYCTEQINARLKLSSVPIEWNCVHFICYSFILIVYFIKCCQNYYKTCLRRSNVRIDRASEL